MKSATLIRRVTDSVAKALSMMKSGIKTEIGELEARVKALEDGSTFADQYKGGHMVGAQHKRGDLVTHESSLWLCLAPTRERPGKSGEWRLIVKGGA